MRHRRSPAENEAPHVHESHRARFLDLPRFFNADPQDARTLAQRAVVSIAAGGDEPHSAAADELVRLGGAAFPYILPLLEALAPDARGRVAMALTPIAARAGVAEGADLTRPETAVLFWTRFWDNRALDFTRSAVDRAVTRLVEHGSDLRAHDLVAVDTFALPEIARAIGTARDPLALERLTRLAQHATGRGRAVVADAPVDEVRRIVADWREWWFVHQTDFVAFGGVERATAFVTDTRFGKWLERVWTGDLGVSVIDGEPIAEKLRGRAEVTGLLCALALLSSFALAVPLGAFGAWRQGRTFDLVSSAVLLVVYATPTFVLAELLRRVFAGTSTPSGRAVLAVASLAAGSLAVLSRWQRAAMLEVMRQDFVRTAHAKGLPSARVAVAHALRNALLPMTTLAGLHLPTLLSGAFVVEEVFRLPGVGFETLRAIRSHDDAWLMAVVMAAAFTVILGLIASDIACGALDPRVRGVLARRGWRGP